MPYSWPVPAYYRDAEFQIIYFRAEPAVVQEHLPEPLAADPAGLAAAFSLRVPWCSAYGPYQELGLRLRCSFRGAVGFYSSHQYNDHVAAMCAGRERWGGPKELAGVQIERRSNLVRAQAVQDGTPIMTLTSSLGRPAQAGEMIALAPSYRLKLIPRADGPGAAIKQLITYVGQDVRCSALYRGEGMILFESSARSDLAPFGPLEVLDAFYQVVSLTEGYGTVVFDYLNCGEGQMP